MRRASRLVGTCLATVFVSAFTLRPTPDGSSTVVVSHETQVGPLPWLGRAYLGPRLRAVNRAMFDDLARAAGEGAATPATHAA